jgi:acetyl esterase/lipase
MLTLQDGNFDVRDVEYLRHGDQALLARVYQPHGDGPFPIVVDIHGGAWTKNDRTLNVDIANFLAGRGIVVVSIDFRMPPEGAYPAAIADINFAIRWSKANAAEFRGTPERVGGLGTSSGGHQILLAAMRPNDSRYASIHRDDVPTSDATLAFVLSGWGVLDPLGRYQMAKEQQKQDLVASHHAFWSDEAAMDEGSPMGILLRGEPIFAPPAMLFQGTAEEWTSYDLIHAFADAYRNRGGEIDVALYEGERHSFIRSDPKSDNSRSALQAIQAFIARHAG